MRGELRTILGPIQQKKTKDVYLAQPRMSPIDG